MKCQGRILLARPDGLFSPPKYEPQYSGDKVQA